MTKYLQFILQFKRSMAKVVIRYVELLMALKIDKNAHIDIEQIC